MGKAAGRGESVRRRETGSGIDYATLFARLPSPCVVLTPDLVIAAVNEAYLQATGSTAENLIGRYAFDAFPDNPDDPHADGVRNMAASLRRVLAHRHPDTLALQRYDIPVPGRPGKFEERWWSPINTPVLAPDGTVAWIIHRTEDVTEYVRSGRVPGRPGDDANGTGEETGGCPGEPGDRVRAMQAELYARSRELQRLNEELRQAHEREHQVALALQRAMLHCPDLDRHPDVAVRYLPALGALNVCGDWYDVVDLPDGRFAVAVGDVVGHGLDAATVMGILRSSLNAAVRAGSGPARALDMLSLCASAADGALATTVVEAVVDPAARRLTYSSAGHPPPVLARRDGTCLLLDQATDPPLGTRPVDTPRPQAELPYTPGDTLVLYTDGLVERRGEDIDAGLSRLTAATARHHALGPAHLADALLTHLGVGTGARDDIALLIVRL